MTGQPRRVTPADINELLDHACQLTPDSPLADQIAFHEKKALLLSRLAADVDNAADASDPGTSASLRTVEAHGLAADAWHHVSRLAAQLRHDLRAGVAS